jgi:hypothetical protein
MSIPPDVLRRLLFAGHTTRDIEVQELIAELNAESPDESLAASISDIFKSWSESTTARLYSTQSMAAWSQTAKASRKLVQDLSNVTIPTAELRKYIDNLYATNPDVDSSGPESMLRSVLESFLADPTAIRRPRTAGPADIWPLLIDIALRKWSDRQARTGEATPPTNALLLEASESAEFVKLLGGLCRKLWSMLSTGEERMLAGLCLQQKSLDQISAVSKMSTEVIDLLLQQLRGHIGQLALTGVE